MADLYFPIILKTACMMFRIQMKQINENEMKKR